MTISRKSGLPIVIAVVGITATLGFLDYIIPHFEAYREYSKDTTDLPKSWLTTFILHAAPWSFALPVIALVVGVDIIRRESCAAPYLLWYVCIFMTSITVWTVLSMFAIFLVDPVFMFGRLVLSK